ncbi:TlyA family RNA methyltransferase [bacterium]|nr:TlyA family RNA methyltransferase [bacterium]
MKNPRVRIDQRLVELNLADSLSQAKAMLMAGEVLVNTKRISQAGTLIAADACVEVRSRSLPFASRGGFKLQKALDCFGLDVSGLTAADIGASTGGFTDCLLQRGIGRVYAVDVGRGQLAPRLSQDPRVIVKDRTNARFLTPADFEQPLNLITVDASFIAISALLPTLKQLLTPNGALIGLIKPQFEAEAASVEPGGVVRSPDTHIQVLQKVSQTASELELPITKLTYSPIKGPAGNIEFLALFSLAPPDLSLPASSITDTVSAAHRELD